MTGERIRIGIVGAGRIVASEHVPRFRAIDGVELVGVANRSEASSRTAADALGLDRSYPSWQALVADPDLDAVLVGAWPLLHAPVSIAALEAGKHVLTEARMAATAEDARAMVRAARAHPDTVAAVVPATFSAWADATIVRLLRAGAIGRVRHVQVAWDSSGPGDPGDFWRWQRSLSGENIMALGILAEAMTRWLGQPRAVTAVTRLGPAERTGPDGPIAADVPDHVLALVDYPDDVTATIEMSARTNGLTSDHVTFHGTTGSLVLDLAAQRMELVRGDARETVTVHDEDRAGWTAEIDFVSAIRGGPAGTLTDFPTGLGYMAFLEAVHRSAASGSRTTIESEAP
jgi:predicted dehydrogenase